MYFFLFLILISLNSFASEENDLIFEETIQYNVNSLGDKTYGHVFSVFHSPEKISEYKEKIGNIEKISPDLLESLSEDWSQYSQSDSVHFGMGEYKDSRTDFKYLCTDEIKDCIGVLFKSEKKSVLYHASKMEIRPTFDSTICLEKYNLPEIKSIFEGKFPPVYLIGSCYSQDLIDLVTILRKNEVKIIGADFPPIVFESSVTKGDSEFNTIAGSDSLYISKHELEDCPFSQKLLSSFYIPSTTIRFDTGTGKIAFSRE